MIKCAPELTWTYEASQIGYKQLDSVQLCPRLMGSEKSVPKINTEIIKPGENKHL